MDSAEPIEEPSVLRMKMLVAQGATARSAGFEAPAGPTSILALWQAWLN